MATDNDVSALTGSDVEAPPQAVSQDQGVSALTGGIPQAPTQPTQPTAPDQTQTTDLTSSITQNQTPQEALDPIASQTSALTSGLGGRGTDQANEQDTTKTSALTVPTEKIVEVTNNTNKYIDPELQAEMDKLNEKRRVEFIEQSKAQAQALTDSFSQKMAQQGYAGTGVKNSLLAMLSASNNASMTAGLQDLAEIALQNEFNMAYQGYQEEQDRIDAGINASRIENMAIFSGLQGDPQEQINFAKLMAEIDPDNPFWQQFLDPEFVKKWPEWQSDEVIARDSEMRALSNSLIYDNWDAINTEGGFSSMFDEWSSTRFEDQEKLRNTSSSWYKNTSLDDINDALERLGYDTIQDKSQITDFAQINKIYQMNEYKKAVKQQTVIKITENARQILTNMGQTLDGKELAFLQEYAGTFIDVLGDEAISIGGFTGTFDQLLNDDSMSFLSFDWEGKPYNDIENLETIQKKAEDGDVVALRTQRLNELWKAYLKKLPNDATPMTRNEFLEIQGILDVAENVEDVNILTSSNADRIIDSAMQEEGFLNQSVVPDEWKDFPENIQQGLTGNSDSVMTSISTMNPAQIYTFSQSDAGKEKIRELVADGKIPSVIGDGGQVNPFDFISYDENGIPFMSPIVSLPDGTILYSDQIANNRVESRGKLEYSPLDGSTDNLKFKTNVREYNRVVKMIEEMNRIGATPEQMLDYYNRMGYTTEASIIQQYFMTNSATNEQLQQSVAGAITNFTDAFRPSRG